MRQMLAMCLLASVSAAYCAGLWAQTAIEELEQRLVEQEAGAGTFSEEIGETAFQLGQLYEQAGQYERALDAFQQSDQRIKIVSGLYAPEREQALREVFQQNLRLGDWKDADAAMQSLGWLWARNMDAASPDYLPLRKEIATWYLASEFYQLEENPLNLLRRAHEQLAEDETVNDLPDSLADADLIRLYLATSYRLSRYAPQSDAGDLQMRLLALERNLELEVSRAISGCYAMFPDSQGKARNCAIQAERSIRSRSPLNDPFFMNEVEEQMYGDRFASDALRRGSNAARNWLEAAEQQGTQQELLDALLLFADWNITIDRFATAKESYARAWQLAHELGVHEEYQFESPHPLHSWGMGERFASISELINPAPDQIALVMQVTEQGRPESIRILNKPDGEEERISHFARQFESIRFRPALSGGEPANTPVFRMTIPLVP